MGICYNRIDHIKLDERNLKTKIKVKRKKKKITSEGGDEQQIK